MEKSVEDFARHLAYVTGENWAKNRYPSEQDEILFLVLKMHLLVEEKLTTIIADHFASYKVANRLNLKYAGKATLAEALHRRRVGDAIRPVEEEVWQVVRDLNTVRNDLAHGLEGHENIVKTVAKLIEKNDSMAAQVREVWNAYAPDDAPRLRDPQYEDATKLRVLFAFVLHALDTIIVCLMATGQEEAKFRGAFMAVYQKTVYEMFEIQFGGPKDVADLMLNAGLIAPETDDEIQNRRPASDSES